MNGAVAPMSGAVPVMVTAVGVGALGVGGTDAVLGAVGAFEPLHAKDPTATIRAIAGPTNHRRADGLPDRM